MERTRVGGMPTSKALRDVIVLSTLLEPSLPFRPHLPVRDELSIAWSVRTGKMEGTPGRE